MSVFQMVRAARLVPTAMRTLPVAMRTLPVASKLSMQGLGEPLSKRNVNPPVLVLDASFRERCPPLGLTKFSSGRMLVVGLRNTFAI